LSAEFRIAETEFARTALASPKHKALAKKLNAFVYPQLRKNPFYGPNIKKLKEELSDFWRYRVGKFRIFYSVEPGEGLVIIHDVQDRKDAYS
jgi:mRNA interferase RelE/StbE